MYYKIEWLFIQDSSEIYSVLLNVSNDTVRNGSLINSYLGNFRQSHLLLANSLLSVAFCRDSSLGQVQGANNSDSFSLGAFQQLKTAVRARAAGADVAAMAA